MIQNPILPGFNPDPSICRKGEDYYLAVSSFEWFPGIPIYHSKDLKHWELYTHVFQSEAMIDLSRLPSGQGIWAPCLTYCEEEDLFYIVYGSMLPKGMSIDNYLMTAKDIRGPWSEPVYLHSAGFDASIFHDVDGRKYILSLDYEPRKGYKRPGEVCMVEYDPVAKSVIGYPKRIWNGSSGRGWIEGPHMYRMNDKYYILCAEGGTFYHHCAAVGRADNVWGPFEKDPERTMLTSIATDGSEGQVPYSQVHLYYNPDSVLQKAGHASLVQTQTGELFAAHHAGRPSIPEKRCVLGRETCIQKMKFTEDGWIRLEDGSVVAKEFSKESDLEECAFTPVPLNDDFDEPTLRSYYYTPRYDMKTFTDLSARKGYIRIRGEKVLTSVDRVSLLARKLSDFDVQVTTKMEFEPEVYKHSAGLVLYYNNDNYLYLRKYYSETLQGPALSIQSVDKGVVDEFLETRVPITKDSPVYLRLVVQDMKVQFMWSYGDEYIPIGDKYDITRFSDEYCNGFTGTFVGIACEDNVLRKKSADFDFFDYERL